MPVILPDDLPASQILTAEGCDVVKKSIADREKLDCLKIGLLNLMPDKKNTETQFARLLGSTPFPIEMKLLRLDSFIHDCSSGRELEFYCSLEKKIAQNIDALIITDAPNEHLDFQEASYWQDLVEAMDIIARHVPETLCVSWGAMAHAYYHHGLDRLSETSKAYQCVYHTLTEPSSPLVFGLENVCNIPTNQRAMIPQTEVDKRKALTTVLSDRMGAPCIIRDRKNSSTYVLVDFEMDADTPSNKYFCDKITGNSVELPTDYFSSKNSTRLPLNSCKTNAKIFYANWMNLVYCHTKNGRNSVSGIQGEK